MRQRIPYGDYCYTTFKGRDGRTRYIYCPHNRYVGKGRVHCKLLGITSVIWSRWAERLAYAFYRRHPKAALRDCGCSFGDDVKQCGINKVHHDPPPA